MCVLNYTLCFIGKSIYCFYKDSTIHQLCKIAFYSATFLVNISYFSLYSSPLIAATPSGGIREWSFTCRLILRMIPRAAAVQIIDVPP